MNIRTGALTGALITSLSLCCAFASPAGEKGKITIKISALRNDHGAVRVAMFNSKESYDSDKFTGDGAFRKCIVELKGTEAECNFDEVPYGEYAIKSFHDEDKSGKFYTGIFGIPKVEYAFSNNALGRFGPASYDEAKFVLGKPELSIVLRMHGKQ